MPDVGWMLVLTSVCSRLGVCELSCYWLGIWCAVKHWALWSPNTIQNSASDMENHLGRLNPPIMKAHIRVQARNWTVAFRIPSNLICFFTSIYFIWTLASACSHHCECWWLLVSMAAVGFISWINRNLLKRGKCVPDICHVLKQEIFYCSHVQQEGRPWVGGLALGPGSVPNRIETPSPDVEFL